MSIWGEVGQLTQTLVALSVGGLRVIDGYCHGSVMQSNPCDGFLVLIILYSNAAPTKGSC